MSSASDEHASGLKSQETRAPRNMSATYQVRDFGRGISNPSIRRLARRGGVKRISGMIYDEVRTALIRFLEGVIEDSVVYMDHGRRKTVMAHDVANALKKRGCKLYGYGQ